MGTVWLINGIPGAGKTTTARALAASFARGVHLEGDRLQDFIVAGGVPPGGEPAEEEARQIHLNVRHQCLLARSFLEAGFTVVVDYVVVNRARVDEYRSQLPAGALSLVTLCPGVQTALARDAPRERPVAARWSHLAGVMTAELSGIGLWLDNATLTVPEVVAAIRAGGAQARVE